MAEDSNSLGAFLLLTLMVIIYFIPTLVAGKRGHPQGTPIFLLNLFAGWTFIGWLAALIWSSSAISEPAASMAPASTDMQDEDRYQKLAKLADLKDRGHLTSEEFEAEKAKILNG